MPPKKTIWPAEPHTIAKHRILRKYLQGWMPALLLGGHPRIVVIDGFCGPGEYVGGEEGSPIIALRAYLDHAHRDRMTGELVFLFIESHRDRARYLEEVALPRLGKLSDNVKADVRRGRFDETMEAVLGALDEHGKRLAPTFAFLDPFGFSDTPMAVIHRILQHPRSELMVTFMIEPVNRFLAHPSEKVAARYDELFGDPGWRHLLDQGNRLDAIGDFYGQQLGQRAKYVWSFRMLDTGNRPVYDLFFGSNHLEGWKKMKRAMWAVDPG
ncbi:MAG: three-Cys-motif partner protein TcmP, partial [Actinomycetota bacterium]